MQPEKISILMMISADFHGKLNFNKEREKEKEGEYESSDFETTSFYFDVMI
jgi:hypothetical protein